LIDARYLPKQVLRMEQEYNTEVEEQTK